MGCCCRKLYYNPMPELRSSNSEKKCPNCGFYLLDVYGRDHQYTRLQCSKCEFNDVIDTLPLVGSFRQYFEQVKAAQEIDKKIRGNCYSAQGMKTGPPLKRTISQAVGRLVRLYRWYTKSNRYFTTVLSETPFFQDRTAT